MSEHAPGIAHGDADQSVSLLKKHHFLLRRLHSLSGIAPVGIFVIAHLFTNFQILTGDIQHEVEWIHSQPALIFVEIGLWASIGFHSVLGVMYMVGWAPNTMRYQYTDNYRYTLQRVTAWLALIFIFLHVATLRWRWNFFGWFTPFFVAGPDGSPLVAATTANALQASVAVVILYAVGVAAVVYHWCNGLWTAAISWGLTISVQAQKRWGYVCLTLGVVLAIWSAGAIVGALKYDVSAAEKAAIQAAIEAHKNGRELPEKATHKDVDAESQINVGKP